MHPNGHLRPTLLGQLAVVDMKMQKMETVPQSPTLNGTLAVALLAEVTHQWFLTFFNQGTSKTSTGSILRATYAKSLLTAIIS